MAQGGSSMEDASGSSPKRRRLSGRMSSLGASDPTQQSIGNPSNRRSVKSQGNIVSTKPVGSKDGSPTHLSLPEDGSDHLGSADKGIMKGQTPAASPPHSSAAATTNPVPEHNHYHHRRHRSSPSTPIPSRFRTGSPSNSGDDDDDDEDEGNDGDQSVHRLVRQESPHTRKHRRSTAQSHDAEPELAQPRAVMPRDHRSASHRAATWRTSDQDSSTGAHESSSSSRSSNRPSANGQTTSNARGGSPGSSSFNLSTGQPLVQPPPKTQAAFVGKLYSMLEDDDIKKEGLIYWSAEGTTFTCPNPTEFSKVLPRFFKHNNWQSFVRQLNMYSFNKVNDLYASSSDPQAWEFRHPLFRRGEPHLLPSIKRKSARTSAADNGTATHSEADELDLRPGPNPAWMRETALEAAAATAAGSAVAAATRPTSSRGRSPARNGRQPLMTYAVHPGDAAHQQLRPPIEEVSRPATSRTFWDRAPPPGGAHSNASVGRPVDPHMAQQQPPPRETRERPRPPAYVASAPYDSPNYPQPAYPSPVSSLASQVAFCEERTIRLADALHVERIDNLRTNIESNSTIMNLVGWLQKQIPGAAHDLAGMQDVLHRQGVDLRTRYDQVVAADTMSGFASETPRPLRDERESSRGYTSHRTPQQPGYPPTSGPPPLSAMARHPPVSEPRPSRSSRDYNLHTPRVSPSMTMSGSIPDSARLPSSLTVPPASSSRPGSGAPSSLPPTSFPPGPPPVSMLPMPFSTSPLIHSRQLSPGPVHPERDRRVAAAASREDDPMDDVKPTGLRNLLNPTA